MQEVEKVIDLKEITVADLKRSNVPDNFWYATLGSIPKHLPYLKKVLSYYAQMEELLDKGVGLYLYSAENQTGKAQPLTSKVLTEKGFIDIGDVKIGDYIFGADGELTEVVGVFPQGVKPCYKVSFLDGRNAECCNEHLWSVYHRSSDYLSTLSLQTMIDKGLKVGKAYRYFVPNNAPVSFQHKETALPIDPYVVGVLIGDGALTCKSNVSFSTTENDIVERVASAIGDDFVVKKCKGGNYSWSITYQLGYHKNLLMDSLKEMGLKGVYSRHRFIPKDYLHASVEVRKLLLAGLFDTDGSVNPNGSFRFSTTSNQLAIDLAFLCRSLGYQCSVSQYDRGAKGLEFNVSILTNAHIFMSDKHTNNYNNSTEGLKFQSTYKRTAVTNIEFVGYKPMVCIKVATKDQLYLTDDFIVTHNTSIAVALLKRSLRLRKTAFFSEAGSLKNALTRNEEFDDQILLDRRIREVDLLVIDDLGKEYKTSSGYAETTFENIVRDRFQSRKSTIVTSNMNPKEIGGNYSPSLSAMLKGSLIPVQVSGYNWVAIREAELKKIL